MLQPFTRKDLMIRSLPDRINDCEQVSRTTMGHRKAGLPDFSWYSIHTKTEKIYHITIKIYQMAIKYNKICKTDQRAI
jgi:hypothetical protein